MENLTKSTYIRSPALAVTVRSPSWIATGDSAVQALTTPYAGVESRNASRPYLMSFSKESFESLFARRWISGQCLEYGGVRKRSRT